MTKVELPISTDYCPDWGVTEGIREFTQNAMDEETRDSTNKMFIKYTDNTDEENGTVLIGNRNSVLDMNTLLFGKTSKRDDPRMIGSHGEGYKIATTVLLRFGKSVVIYNYDVQQIWQAKLVRSRKFKGELIPTFFMTHTSFLRPSGDNNLVIKIGNISHDEWDDIVDSNLNLQKDLGETIDTSVGKILLDDKFSGKLYVSGLYICDNESSTCGYSFKPEQIRLDRDRRLVPDFELKWTASKAWSEVSNSDLVMKHINDPECSYLSSNSVNTDLSSKVVSSFISKYGNNSVPVVNDTEKSEAIRLGKNPVIVSSTVQDILVSSNEDMSMSQSIDDSKGTISERLEMLRDKLDDARTVSDEDIEELNDIISILKL
jgi:hypothetical protein